MKVIGCGRASKTDQELTLVAQRRRLEAACAERGWQLVEYVEDQQGHGKTGVGLAWAIEEVRSKRADVLMIAKLDRLPRSVASITALMEQAHRERWKLLILDQVDMTTPMGKAMAQMAAVFAELERALNSARTRDALAELKAEIAEKGSFVSKAGNTCTKLGPPIQIPRPVEDRIGHLLDRGWSPQRVADTLNAERVPTVRGGAWTRDTVRRIRERRAA